MTKSLQSLPKHLRPPYSDNVDSAKLMAQIDSLKPAMRALVYEFGAAVVLGMIADGHRNADALRDILEMSRYRRLEEWLEELPYSRAPRPAPVIADPWG